MIHVAYVLGLADGRSVKPVLLLSDGVIVTPQTLHHAQPRQQTPDCVVEEKKEKIKCLMSGRWPIGMRINFFA